MARDDGGANGLATAVTTIRSSFPRAHYRRTLRSLRFAMGATKFDLFKSRRRLLYSARQDSAYTPLRPLLDARTRLRLG